MLSCFVGDDVEEFRSIDRLEFSLDPLSFEAKVDGFADVGYFC